MRNRSVSCEEEDSNLHGILPPPLRRPLPTLPPARSLRKLYTVAVLLVLALMTGCGADVGQPKETPKEGAPVASAGAPADPLDQAISDLGRTHVRQLGGGGL